jgi:hypothetical protein
VIINPLTEVVEALLNEWGLSLAGAKSKKRSVAPEQEANSVPLHSDIPQEKDESSNGL